MFMVSICSKNKKNHELNRDGCCTPTTPPLDPEWWHVAAPKGVLPRRLPASSILLQAAVQNVRSNCMLFPFFLLSLWTVP